MKLKSGLMMLMTSTMMLAPVISTGLTSVSADTVNDNSTQVSTRNVSLSPTNGVVTVTVRMGRMYDDNLQFEPARVLPYQSAWKTDKIAYDSATGKEYFRIAPNEWVISDDVVFSY